MRASTLPAARPAPTGVASAENLRDAFIRDLWDLDAAGRQIARAVAALQRAAAAEPLRLAFQRERYETRRQIDRVHECLKRLAPRPNGVWCEAVETILGEVRAVIDDGLKTPVRDAALMSLARRLRDYEMAAYETLVARASALGWGRVATLLQENLDEQREAESRLSDLARGEAKAEPSGRWSQFAGLGSPLSFSGAGGVRHSGRRTEN